MNVNIFTFTFIFTDIFTFISEFTELMVISDPNLVKSCEFGYEFGCEYEYECEFIHIHIHLYGS